MCGSPELYATGFQSRDEWFPVVIQAPSSSIKTNKQFFVLQNLPHDIDLIIGEARSECSIAIAAATKDKKIPQMSYASTSAQLSDKQTYPNFFRTCASDLYQGKALAKLVQRYKWTQVSTVTTIDSYSEELARKFAVEVRQLGVDIATEQRFEAHTKANIKEHLREVGGFLMQFMHFFVLFFNLTKRTEVCFVHSPRVQNSPHGLSTGELNWRILTQVD